MATYTGTHTVSTYGIHICSTPVINTYGNKQRPGTNRKQLYVLLCHLQRSVNTVINDDYSLTWFKTSLCGNLPPRRNEVDSPSHHHSQGYRWVASGVLLPAHLPKRPERCTGNVAPLEPWGKDKKYNGYWEEYKYHNAYGCWGTQTHGIPTESTYFVASMQLTPKR